MSQLPCYGREKRGDANRWVPGLFLNSPLPSSGFGKLCGGLSQGGELIGDFPQCLPGERAISVSVLGGARGACLRALLLSKRSLSPPPRAPSRCSLGATGSSCLTPI